MLPPTVEELEQARQFLLGSLLLGIATQAGLAGMASNYAAYGLRLDFLTEYTAQLAAVTVEDIMAAGAAFLAPAKAITVVLGDADVVGDGLAALGPVERVATGEQ
jgi:predicted Zn-dependent peptidase